MKFTNKDGWPEEILGIVEKSLTVEYASLTRKGVPITLPLLNFVGEDGRTLDVNTGLTYASKAQRARNNPKVSLLYSEPIGSGLEVPPAVLIYGEATVRDADLQANTDRHISASFQRFPETYSQMPRFIFRTMSWYLARIWILVTPLRILWWKGGDLTKEPKSWQAPDNRRAMTSDPPPVGKGLKLPSKPPAEWRSGAEYAVQSLGKPVLTVVDPDGYPIPFPTQGASLTSDGFELQLFSTIPAPAQGKACLTFHHYVGKLTLQENEVFVGDVSGDAKRASFQVDHRLEPFSMNKPQLQIMIDMLKLRHRLLPRLKTEAERRGQPVPKVRLPRISPDG